MNSASAKSKAQTVSGKGLAAFSYLFGFLSGFLVLLIEKNNRFVRFHALQSVITFVILFLVTVFFELTPGAGPVIAAVVLLFSVVLALWLMTAALLGKYSKVPSVGDVVEQQV